MNIEFNWYLYLLLLRMAKLILNVDSSLCNFSSHIPDNLIPSKYILIKLLFYKHFGVIPQIVPRIVAALTPRGPGDHVLH